MTDIRAQQLKRETVRKYENLFYRRLLPWCEEKGFRYLKQLGVEEMRQFRAAWSDSANYATKNLERLRALNQTWALDYMTDALYDGQRFRVLTLLDEGNRETLTIEIATSIPSPRVVRLLDELVALHGRPCALRVDNGPEFTAQPLVAWGAALGIALHYIQPGKPGQNAYIERFNRSYRHEVLDTYAFESVSQVRAVSETWRDSYNRLRPHDSLGEVPPLTFLSRPISSEASTLRLST